MNPILSILTPAVPSRIHSNGQLDAQNQLEELMDTLEKQIGKLPVEHLVFVDNKRRTIGEKRDALLRMARGQYVAFVDDDDWVSDDYVAELLKAAKERPDVITFQQRASVNGEEAIVEFKLGNPNEAFCGMVHLQEMGDRNLRVVVRRNAWHVCAWRRTLAIQSHFPAVNYSEDWAFAAPLCALLGLREVHIPKVLHYYRHSSETTEAPQP